MGEATRAAARRGHPASPRGPADPQNARRG